METWSVLLDVVILLGTSLLLGAICERLGQSAIVGYLLGGALLGPNAFHLIASSELVSDLAELGVALLLFAIGLEFSWNRLRALGKVAFAGGAAQILATGLVFGLGALALGQAPPAAFALGAIGALSSTAAVLRALTARGALESMHGNHALGVLLMQDVAVVPLVLMVSVFAEGGTALSVLLGIVRTLGIGAFLIALMYLVFNHGAPRLLKSVPMHTNRELPVLLAVVSGLGSALICHVVGVSPALGAFVAGLLLADSPFAVQVQADVSALKTLLMTLFFSAIGMLVDPAWIAGNLGLVVGVTLAVLALKTVLTWGCLRLIGAPHVTALASGLALAQIGEFSFVLVEIARGRILDEDVFRLVVATSVITMMLTPYLVGNARTLAVRLYGRQRLARAVSEERKPEEGLVVVIGFGPAARIACERIAQLEKPIVVVEFSPRSGSEARALGYRSVTGDARSAEVLAHAGVARAEHVLVTVPDPVTATQVIRLVRRMAPKALILARARFHRYRADIEHAGAHRVIDEELDVGRSIAAAFDEEMARREAETKAKNKEAQPTEAVERAG